MEDNQEKKSPSKWAAMINIPIQMGVIIFIFTYAGMWLDEKYSNGSSTWTIILSLLSVFIALYNVIRQVKNLNK
ncbi:AtpZ/AtpI family protein [Flavobacterium macacae]|uniref:AtpZ/AtpI family protein n=1 Tax=Flavobacterium macacae TaxID=2488993 RepID=A0A3P3WG81_9FLAO|nr:AtpZ/AtpI family protein [Flavobacterium macacae]RRJ94120.1 AtpZ/AtpI family protein [Flavobacterium macacae]